MMVINTKYISNILVVFFFAAALTASAQKHEDIVALSAKNYQMEYLRMSEDGKWFTFKKRYDSNTDTLAIINRQKTDKIAGYRTRVEQVEFLKSNLLLKTEGYVEFLDLKKNTSLYFKGDFKMKTLSNGQFLLHDNKSRQLLLYNEKGTLISIIDKIVLFYNDQKENVYAVVEKSDNHYAVVLFNERSIETVYQTRNQISQIVSFPDTHSLLIYQKTTDGNFKDLVYINLTTGFENALKHLIKDEIKDVFIEKEIDDYFLIKVISPVAQDSQKMVNIWYGHDNNLEAKFSSSQIETYYLWNPQKNITALIGNNELTRSFAIGNHIFSYDPFHFKNYLTYHSMTPLDIYHFNAAANQHDFLDTIDSNSVASSTGNFLLSKKHNVWYLYDLNTMSKVEIKSVQDLNAAFFSSDNKHIFFESDSGLWKYTISSKELFAVDDFKGYKTKILNGVRKNLSRTQIFEVGIDAGSPLIIELEHLESNKKSWVLWDGSKTKTVLDFTLSLIKSLTFDKSMRYFSYIQEDYNLPPRLLFKPLNGSKEVLFQSNPQDIAIRSLKKETYSYSGGNGEELKSVLYYPLRYDASKKYPMVVHIYQVQSHKTNYYPMAAYSTPNFYDGFNLRLLLELGYFVFLPDIVYGKEGTGLSALLCVENALDALQDNDLIDFSKVGLIGHSHGGYQTNFIATHSDRFAAFVSGSGNSDIIRSYFSFNYNFLIPFYYQYEKGQYEMGKSFTEDKDLYFRNNPIHYADQVKSPILLWTGMKDQNIYWEQTMEFYIALKRNEKKVISLFYPEEEHSLINEKPTQDLALRVLQWFNYFLKEEKEVEWIDKEMKKDAD